MVDVAFGAAQGVEVKSLMFIDLFAGIGGLTRLADMVYL